MLARDDRTRNLVTAEAVQLSEAFLEDMQGGPGALRQIDRAWFRVAARLGQRLTIPGLFVHYAVRKNQIETAVRQAVAVGCIQVVIIGAGFDTIAARLHREMPAIQFFELDHPATQAAKRGSLEKRGLVGSNLHFVSADLRSTTPEAALRATSGFHADLPAVVIIEGVLMYIPAEGVERTLRGLRQALAPGSQLVFTFIAESGDGTIRFTRQTFLATWWLKRKKEPFLWASTPSDVKALLERSGFLLVEEPSDPAPVPAGFALPGGELIALAHADDGFWLNDVQTRLNPTRVHRVARPTSTAAVQALVRQAAREGAAISVAGGRHAQGGQQFARDALHLDMTAMSTIFDLDSKKGIVHAQAGIQWPQLITELAAMQTGSIHPWGIVQKQTGANNLTLGGALSANVHGRGLRFAPIVQDVEAFLLVDHAGKTRRCSRTEDAELFALAIGGYGLFGVITEVWLRLQPRRVLERVVECIPIEDLEDRLRERIAAGFLYGDFQYATDPASSDFMRVGVFSCYRPSDRPLPKGGQRILAQDDWDRLVALAHRDRSAAFARYREHYLATTGQLYDSDQHQLATYLEDYHQRFDAATGATPACEVISELYVPRPALAKFLEDVATCLRAEQQAPVYGTIRLIEKDEESFLAWAREPWACTIVNLHVDHTAESIVRAQVTFRKLFDIALAHNGSFFLTYHRWATRLQVERAYPQMRAFLAAKRRHDPATRFRSEWYHHMAALFDEAPLEAVARGP